MNRKLLMALEPIRGWSRHRATTVLVVVVTMVALAQVGGAAFASRKSHATPTPASPFAASSPWRQSLPPNPMIDPNSASMIAAVQPRPALAANLVEFGIPIYRTSADDPTYALNCTQADWGVCPLAGWEVTIPDGAAPHVGSDHALVTVDERRGLVFELWQA
nr:hypothetical protein [Actinomycetes bacterium]